MNYYSFDIFDTCLVRLCGESRNVIEVLSTRFDFGGNETLRRQFVSSRISADNRDLSTLTEIYSRMSADFPLPKSPEDMAEIEMQIEKELIVPVVKMRDIVNTSRKKGSVLFISDMYLPEAFLRNLLQVHGFFYEGDSIYVSCEHNASKRSGVLFKIIHERERIPYSRWHHYGDNQYGDIKVPRKLGIHAHKTIHPYLHYERKWRNIPVLGFQYTSMLAGISRGIRLSNNAPKDQKAFVCDISAPFIVFWTLNIMSEAASEGIKRLYFCARDARAEYIVAKKFKPLFPNLEIRYLFISRQSLKTDNNILIEWLRQEGIASDDPVAIVDTNTTGKTIHRINEILISSRYQTIKGWFFSRVPYNGSYILVDEASSVDNNFFADSSYLNSVSGKVSGMITGLSVIYEILFSLNCHKKTIGYAKDGVLIKPVLSIDNEDLWQIKPNSIQAMHANNDLLECYADAVIRTNLVTLHKDILNNQVISSLFDFLQYPRKEYLSYMRRFIWKGKPFVDNLWKTHIWKRGSRAYSIPPCVLDLLYHYRKR